MTMTGEIHLDVYKNKELICARTLQSSKAIDYILDLNKTLLDKGFKCSTSECDASRVMAYQKGTESLNLIIKRK